MMNVEDIKMKSEVLLQYRVERVIDTSLRLRDHTVQSCPGTSFTKLMVECMDREPHMG